MKYKDYESIVTFDKEARLFHGEVINIRDVITFQGTNVDDLEKAFRDSVDDYLDFCTSRGEHPDKPFSGKLIVRITPELHREVSLKAKKERVSVNRLISKALSEYTTGKKD